MCPLTSSWGSPSESRRSAVRKGAWSQEEDALLRQCIEKHGAAKWGRVPQLAGLNRCRKSCRLRWLNYLHPGIKRGSFAEDEEDLIVRLHKLLGNRWSLIAGRIPGRTANDVKNYWNSHLTKKLIAAGKKDGAARASELIKPQPRKLRANGAEQQRTESEMQEGPWMGEDHGTWVDEHVMNDHTGWKIMEDLKTRMGVCEDMVGCGNDDVVTTEEDIRWESFLSDIDLWGV